MELLKCEHEFTSFIVKNEGFHIGMNLNDTPALP